MKGKYLVTTSEWFYAPDGKQYKAAWGEIEILEDSFLGIKTNRNSTNWYAKIGKDRRHIIIAGCQINYAIECEEKPYTGDVITWNTGETGINTYYAPTSIYLAE